MPTLATDQESTMKAIVQDVYGTADVLELRHIDKPDISDNEVLVRVHAAGVDRGVWHLMTGCRTSYASSSPISGAERPRTPSEVATWPASWRPSATT